MSMSLRESVVYLLQKWENSDRYADILLEEFFQKSNWKQADKALIQELFLGVLRCRKKIDYIIEQFFQGKIGKAPKFVKFLLQSAVYQLLFLERIPDYAIVNETVKIARKKGGRYWAGKINAILRNVIRRAEEISFPSPKEDIISHIAIVHSHPEWLVKKWVERFGVEETVELCQANNQRPVVTLRRNNLKISAEDFRKYLTKAGIDFLQLAELPDFYQVKNFPAIEANELFKTGAFSIQDASAGLSCLLLAPKPGEKIVDLCSAPGGKTTYLLELSEGRAMVISVDLNFNRLLLVRENLRRLNFPDDRLVQADATNFSAVLVDKILIDAPCSGLGVMAKRADLRWRRKESDLSELQALQYKILNNAANLVKKGGVIVYSTCTIEPEENEEIVKKFLQEHKEFSLDEAEKFVPAKFVSEEGWVRTLPHRHGIDGIFAARLIKS